MRENTISALTAPITYDGSNFCEQLEQAYDIFNNSFLKKDVRPFYNDKFIFFNTNQYVGKTKLQYPERFLHIISLGDDEKFNMYPCTNEVTYELCENQCENPSFCPSLQFLHRWECLYRLNRIHWIREVIDLANSENRNITEWSKEGKDSRGQKKFNRFIRYHKGMDDYVIILEERENDYCFITAYPVLTKKTKQEFDSAYSDYSKK